MINKAIRQMAIPGLNRLRAPASLQWWEWCKLTGLIGLVALIAAVFARPAPFFIALALHWACDITVQSGETAMRKKERGRHLALHAIMAGGLPMAVAGLTISPVHAIIWAVVGVVSHYAIDYARKFGLGETMIGFVADQAAHLAILAITLLV